MGSPKHVSDTWQVLADALLQLFGKSLSTKPIPVKGNYSNIQNLIEDENLGTQPLQLHRGFASPSYRNPSAGLNFLQDYKILRNVSIRNPIVIERGVK